MWGLSNVALAAAEQVPGKAVLRRLQKALVNFKVWLLRRIQTTFFRLYSSKVFYDIGLLARYVAMVCFTLLSKAQNLQRDVHFLSLRWYGMLS